MWGSKEGVLDSRHVTDGPFPYLVEVFPDDDQSPEEWTSEAENPELFEAWRNGNMQYVGVRVTRLDRQDCSDSLWGLECGSCASWQTVIDMDHLCSVYPVPGMVEELS